MHTNSRSDNRSSSTSAIRHTPFQIIHVLGVFMRTWSVYSLYHHLSLHGDSVIVFLFTSLVPASFIFLSLQKPWKGRSLSNSQVVPSVVNGGIMALYFVLWGKGLKASGPSVAILTEYSGVALGVLSAVLFGRRGQIWKKVGGLVAMFVGFYFLSMGWATRTFSPFYVIGLEPVSVMKETLGANEMLLLIAAGILSALRRVVARRVSLKNQLKRRLHAITVASSACFLFPLAIWELLLGGSSSDIIKLQFPTWAYLSTVAFGIVFIYYVDNLAEERLHLVFSSPKHLLVAGVCVIVMEIAYKMDFSLLGFLLCFSSLSFGIYEATSLGRMRKDHVPQHISDGMFHTEKDISSLPS
ncbi:hypothetical protein ZOSMA_1G00860 [Zostera marina]|uniref:Uncharacterized protein n=1 Tax=Zostera marina TaxID=29655 RepID=A0A0K9PPG8_ZOSMR|nr:hypothetical protein ZOSMA_1G00860 [Zostera marina]